MLNSWRPGQLAQDLEAERVLVTAFPQADARMIPGLRPPPTAPPSTTGSRVRPPRLVIQVRSLLPACVRLALTAVRRVRGRSRRVGSGSARLAADVRPRRQRLRRVGRGARAHGVPARWERPGLGARVAEVLRALCVVARWQSDRRQRWVLSAPEQREPPLGRTGDIPPRTTTGIDRRRRRRESVLVAGRSPARRCPFQGANDDYDGGNLALIDSSTGKSVRNTWCLPGW